MLSCEQAERRGGGSGRGGHVVDKVILIFRPVGRRTIYFVVEIRDLIGSGGDKIRVSVIKLFLARSP